MLMLNNVSKKFQSSTVLEDISHPLKMEFMDCRLPMVLVNDIIKN